MEVRSGFTGLAGAVGSSLLLGIVSVLGGGVIATAAGATANTWTVAADNLQAPDYQTATVLADGRVLVVGGQGTKAMTRPRAVFTSTLLLDETVLVADYGETDLYDPATGRFTATAPLPPDIDAITAVRLRDGRVLSTGGSRGSTTAAQIYVPSTRTWQAAASLNWSRYYAPWGAVLLDDGRVLVVGGTSSSKIAETWDPELGFWTNTGPLFNARTSNFGLVRLNDGRVLVNGGAEPDVWCDNEGGGCEVGPTHATEIYTP